MGVILDANYTLWKDNKRQVMPAPVDPDTPNVDWWYNHVAQKVATIKQAGFTAVQLPPFCKTQGGSANDADGYGLFDPYDIGSKNQSYSVPTRFGTAEQLRRCIAILHANGIQVYGDVVLHQYDGGNNREYKYLGSDGKTLNGRFPKTASCFAGPPPGVMADPVFDPQGNFAFGDLVSFVNSKPPDYMASGTIDATDWLIRTTGIDGIRVDDVKGLNVDFCRRFLNSKSVANVFAYGELFDGNPDTLSSWVFNCMEGRAGVIDFTLKFNLQNMANNANNWWMGQLDNIGYCQRDSAHALTFVESRDTDTSPGEQVIWNKALAYAIMLTFPGYPKVYWKDWSDDPNCYNLKEVIENLIWIHEHLANGNKVTRWGNDPQVYVHERLGWAGLPGCLCGFNNDRWNTHTVTVQTAWYPNTRLHEFTGHYNTDIWTDSGSRATFTLPPNNNGLGYLVFGPWPGGPDNAYTALKTKQVFFGASDLDTPPILKEPGIAGSIYCQQSIPITCRLASLKADKDGTSIPSGTQVELDIKDPTGISHILTLGEESDTALYTPTHSGKHELRLSSAVPFPLAYELEVTYMGEGINA